MIKLTKRWGAAAQADKGPASKIVGRRADTKFAESDLSSNILYFKHYAELSDDNLNWDLENAIHKFFIYFCSVWNQTGHHSSMFSITKIGQHFTPIIQRLGPKPMGMSVVNRKLQTHQRSTCLLISSL